MRRLPDWQSRLQAYVLAVAAEPFSPGRMDCALFAAGAVEAMTGIDPAILHRGRYRTLKGGLKRLRRTGFDDHVALADALLVPVPVAYAEAGDLAVVSGPQGPSLGVVQGAQVYAMTPAGLGLVPLSDATTAFRVTA